MAQAIEDGPIALEVRLQEIEIPFEAQDEAAFGVDFATEEFSFTVYAADAPNLDGASWLSSPACLRADLIPPATTGAFDAVLLQTNYDGRQVPASVDIRFDGWEDEAADAVFTVPCSSDQCVFEGSMCCGPQPFGICIGQAEEDDSRCNAAPFATGLDYRLGRACDTFDHGFIDGSCPADAAYRPRITTSWRYLDGDTADAAHDMGTVAAGAPLLHRNGLGCYTDSDASVLGPDAFVAFDTAESGTVSVSVCDDAGGDLAAVLTTATGDVDVSTSCTSPFEVTVCSGAAWLLRVDDAGPAAFDVRVAITPPTVGDARLCCGDGIVDVNEACDDAGESAECDADCSLAFCGDGTTNASAGETCDDAGSSTTCDVDCTAAVCGDGLRNVAAGEQCDAGADNGQPLGCASDCSGITASVCGNGVSELGEFCDDGGASERCDADCTDVVCGDLNVNEAAGERCDDGRNNGRPLACAIDCQGITPAFCGNGAVEIGEECDARGFSVLCDGDCTLAVCGDGVVNDIAGERCDDGNTSDNDACRNDCQGAVCGDGIVWAGVETCDDGPNNGLPGACALDCAGTTPASCGNGVLEAGERCDDAGASLTCDPDCTEAVCGDSFVNAAAGEVCDDGPRNGEPFACNADCSATTAAVCGNGITEAGERCDDFGESASCDADCTDAICGDGTTNATALEECDTRGSTPECDDDCTRVTCGDGTFNPAAGEACDDGNDVNVDACLSTCQPARCGDGVIWSGIELCDDGARNGTPGACALDCSGITSATCGNGTVEDGEDCDDAGLSETCDPDCTFAACGDGFVNVQASERCDDGPRNGEPLACDLVCGGITTSVCGNGTVEPGERCDDAGPSAVCDADCTNALCGDGTINDLAGEVCDDGAANGEPLSCNATCSGPTDALCGNGVVEGDEACDDGEQTDACNANCTIAACGDGITNAAAGEACDDGNLIETDACTNGCAGATCGDGLLWEGVEFCDDGLDNGLPTRCSLDCSGITSATCGNGTLEGDEACDDAGESDACDPDCSVATCGDGFTNPTAGEVCDDGERNGSPLACAIDCAGVTPPVCGNSVLEPGEQCDDGDETETCDLDCSRPVCGDGLVNALAGEACDPGEDPTCLSDCSGQVAEPSDDVGTPDAGTDAGADADADADAEDDTGLAPDTESDVEDNDAAVQPSEEDPLALVRVTGGGCAAAPQAPSPWSAVLLLGLLGLIRRRQA